ncbi:terminase [Limosilactobacillus reuteri]|uniref:Terminase n=1 Tax=Limosilactobacillus reuteri TaxID=1598 RepID=A0A317GIR4_LIMRT|nr:terminase TerL endonuclease subunit [Limosilactobacillus reuteri]MCH5384698.1 terminase large subunit [Limosilactobacillus reuteri]PWT48600.1 terminase [Limosilactobacillus reuteri]PWT53252.1 terminase [Limosilactobacillus reuteri]PWT63861.1 terminase [Limosilactobacillus reuteri]
MKIDLTQTHDVLGAYQTIDFSNIRDQYHDSGTKYCFDVLDGKLTTGYQIKLACFRHLRDLQRQNTEEFPYYYDVNEVRNILKFASVCPEIKTRKPVKLMGWQKFVLAMLVGWRNKKGDKRFTRAILSVARHNGKTYLMAIVTIYSFLIEAINEAGQDFLVSSINYKQTSKLMGYIKQMLRYLMDVQPFGQLALELGINPKTLSSQSDQIIMSKTGSRLLAVTYKSGQYDSFHFKTAIGDEFADPEVGDNSKISKITSGQLDVTNKQFIQISTAYDNPTVPFHNDEKRLENLMEADYLRQGDAYLVLNWCQDDENEVFKPETWAKSNPLMDMPGKRESFTLDLKTERDNNMLTGNMLGFQNKSMNIWMQQSADSFLKLDDIEKAIIPDFDIYGRQVYIGFDYSMFSDNTAIAFVYPYQDHNGKQKWHVEQHSFIPWNKAGSIEAKEKQDGINYRHLAEKGFCTITSHPQGLINDEQVYNWLLNYVEENNLQVVFFGYDAWGATTAIKQMDINTDYPLEAIRQRTSELKDPTKFLQKLFVEGNITRLDDRIMEKALVNAEIYEDKIGIQVDKSKATLKIDVVDAIIDALYQGMYHFEDFGIANDKSKQVDRMTEEQVKAWFENKDSGLLDD